MNRRQLLRACAVGGLLPAGCLSRSDRPAGTPPSESPSTRTATDGERRVRVERVETDTYVIRLNYLGNSPHASIPELSDFDDRERAVVEAAIEGSYETDDVPAWLAKFASRTRFVRADGNHYRLEYTLPVYTITAEAVAEDEVSGEIANLETYREAVTHDGRRMTGLMRIAREEGFRTNYVWPSLREFLDGYDAVRFEGDVLDFEETVEDLGSPYEITAEPASLDDLADGPVWDVSEAPSDVQEVVREAGASSGAYSLAEPPEGLLESLDAHEYVFLDGTFYTTYVENRDAHDVSLTAEAVEGDDGSAPGLRLALGNDSDGSIEVMSGAPRPFGVLTCHSSDDPDARHLLWTDAYEENDHVHTEGREVVAIADIGLTTTVDPGGEVGREFELPTDLSAGEYVVDHSLGIEYAEREGGTFPFRVVFSVE